jgi:hypothetical protein
LRAGKGSHLSSRHSKCTHCQAEGKMKEFTVAE